MPDINLRYYIDGPHGGSGLPLIFSSPTFSHFYRLRFEIHDPGGKLVLLGDIHPLGAYFLPFPSKRSVCLIGIEPLSASEKSNEEEVCSHKMVAERSDIYWLRDI